MPAPATAILLEGLEIAPNGPVVGEATTPTGAALLQSTVCRARHRPGGGRLEAGLGSGRPEPRGLSQRAAADPRRPARVEAGEVVLLSTDLDDLSPEYLDPLAGGALCGRGARRAGLGDADEEGPGRFSDRGHRGPGRSRPGGRALFRHSTTAGIRRHTAERVTLARREVEVTTADGSCVRVKVLEGPDGPRVKPEYEDVAAVARRTGQTSP